MDRAASFMNQAVGKTSPIQLCQELTQKVIKISETERCCNRANSMAQTKKKGYFWFADLTKLHDMKDLENQQIPPALSQRDGKNEIISVT